MLKKGRKHITRGGLHSVSRFKNVREYPKYAKYFKGRIGRDFTDTMDLTLRLLSIIRLIHPHVLLPATTALGTIDPKGREKGILAGGNVVMPNLSPVNVRDKYKLYDNKICTGDEAAECKACMAARMKSIGYEVVTDRGDYKV